MMFSQWIQRKLVLAVAFVLLIMSWPPSGWAQDTLKGYDRVTFGRQRGAKGTAHFYRNGLIVFETNVWTGLPFTATRANSFIVLVDAKGRALFVTKEFQMTTAVATTDPSGKSDVYENFQFQCPPEIGPLVTRVDCFFYQRNNNNFWRNRVNAVNEAVKAYDDLDPKVKAAIAAALVAL